MFKDILNSMLLDMRKYNRKDKSELFSEYVNERLNQSLETYYKEIAQSVQYLTQRDELKMMKKLNKGG